MVGRGPNRTFVTRPKATDLRQVAQKQSIRRLWAISTLRACKLPRSGGAKPNTRNLSSCLAHLCSEKQAVRMAETECARLAFKVLPLLDLVRFCLRASHRNSAFLFTFGSTSEHSRLRVRKLGPRFNLTIFAKQDDKD